MFKPFIASLLAVNISASIVGDIKDDVVNSRVCPGCYLAHPKWFDSNLGKGFLLFNNFVFYILLFQLISVLF